MSSIEMKIDGMSCNHCVMAVKKAIESIDEVENAHVDLPGSSAVVTLKQNKDIKPALQQAVTDAGYVVSSIK